MKSKCTLAFNEFLGRGKRGEVNQFQFRTKQPGGGKVKPKEPKKKHGANRLQGCRSISAVV